jgi:putative ABC transport system permease protein
MIVCVLFTIIPIAQTYEIKPIQLLRLSANNSINYYSKKIKLLIFTLLCSLCFLTISLTNNLKISFYIFVARLISFLILQVLTSLFFKLFNIIKFKTGSTIEMVRNSLVVRNSFAKPIVISFSVGLILLITLNIIEQSLDKKITNTLNQEAPNNFLIDIQPNQIKKIESMAQNSIGKDKLNAQPMLRGRITEINNVKVENLKVNKDVQWVLKRDRAFSWTNELPKKTKLLSGKWWPYDYDGPLLVSIGHKIAKGLKINIGDKIKFNVLGRNFEAKVFNTRELLWENMNINFIFILSKSRIENAPHTWIATTSTKKKIENNNFIEQIVTQFSNVSTISIEESYKAIKSILNLLIIIINAIALLTLFSGVIVLMGILDVSKKDKLYEVAVFKILGATLKKITQLWLLEYLIIGLVSSTISMLVGIGISFIIVNYVFNIDMHIDYIRMLVLLLLIPVTIVFFSYIKTIKLIASKPLNILRVYF